MPLLADAVGDIAKIAGPACGAIAAIAGLVKFLFVRRDKRRRKKEEEDALAELEEGIKEVAGTAAGVIIPVMVGFSVGGSQGALKVLRALVENAVVGPPQERGRTG